MLRVNVNVNVARVLSDEVFRIFLELYVYHELRVILIVIVLYLEVFGKCFELMLILILMLMLMLIVFYLMGLLVFASSLYRYYKYYVRWELG